MLFLDVKEPMIRTNENSLKSCYFFVTSCCDADLDDWEMLGKIMDCRKLLKTRANVKLERSDDQLTSFVKYGDDAFSNQNIGLQILLTVATSIGSCERSFYITCPAILKFIHGTREILCHGCAKCREDSYWHHKF